MSYFQEDVLASDFDAVVAAAANQSAVATPTQQQQQRAQQPHQQQPRMTAAATSSPLPSRYTLPSHLPGSPRSAMMPIGRTASPAGAAGAASAASSVTASPRPAQPAAQPNAHAPPQPMPNMWNRPASKSPAAATPLWSALRGPAREPSAQSNASLHTAGEQQRLPAPSSAGGPPLPVPQSTFMRGPPHSSTSHASAFHSLPASTPASRPPRPVPPPPPPLPHRMPSSANPALTTSTSANIWQQAAARSPSSAQQQPARSAAHTTPMGSSASSTRAGVVPSSTSSSAAPSAFAAAASSSFAAAAGASSASAPVYRNRFIPAAPTISSSMSLPGQSVSIARRIAPASPPRPTCEQKMSSAELRVACDAFMRAEPKKRVNPIDPNAIGAYHYPQHLSDRVYQRDIVWTCLRYNTLVCLPTGTGKTLIGAVLLYNFYRWYPRGKVLFVAPTRPLVVQQQRACCEMMGIPIEHTCVLISGAHDAAARRAHWQSTVEQLVFATPQAIMSDIDKGIVPVSQIVCLCVDECHKAQKSYSYVDIVRQLALSGHEFRVVGLSATPGADLRAVRVLFDNLRLSHLELRDEADDDLAPYMQKRDIEMILVEQSISCDEIQAAINACLRPKVATLVTAGILQQSDPARLHPVMLHSRVKDLTHQHESGTIGLSDSEYFAMLGEIGVCKRLLGARDRLKSGVSQCWEYLQENIIGDKRGHVVDAKVGRKPPTHAVNAMRHSVMFTRLCDLMKTSITTLADDLAEDEPIAAAAAADEGNGDAAATSTPRFQSMMSALRAHHPKIAKLVEVVSHHFTKVLQKAEWTALDQAAEEEHSDDDEDAPIARGGGSSSISFKGCASQSNVIVFTELRDSVEEIVKHLNHFSGIAGIRATPFIGQAGKKGMNQKTQASVLQQFRDGAFNVIVATCVAEEGLDIGHVDLIVSFDVVGSPLRIVQRFGRTGRKRRGRCVTLVGQGKEEETYHRAWAEKGALVAELKKQGKMPWFAWKSQMRMIPDGITPVETLVQVATTKQTSHRGGGGNSDRSSLASGKKSDWRVPLGEAARLQRKRPHSNAEGAHFPTAPNHTVQVGHSTRTRIFIQVAAHIDQQQRQIDDGGADESARKRRRLNADTTRELDAIFDDDEVIHAVGRGQTPSDESNSDTTGPSATPQRSTSPIKVHAPGADPGADHAPPVAAARPKNTLTEMFGKQTQAQHRPKRREEKAVMQPINAPTMVTWTLEQLCPSGSMAILSLLPASMRQMAMRYTPAKPALRCQHTLAPAAHTDAHSEHKIAEAFPCGAAPTAAAFSLEMDQAATAAVADDGPQPMDVSESAPVEERKTSSSEEAQSTLTDPKPVPSAPLVPAAPAPVVSVSHTPRPPPPPPLPPAVVTAPCIHCHRVMPADSRLSCIVCTSIYGCTACNQPGGQCSECSMAFELTQEDTPILARNGAPTTAAAAPSIPPVHVTNGTHSVRSAIRDAADASLMTGVSNSNPPRVDSLWTGQPNANARAHSLDTRPVATNPPPQGRPTEALTASVRTQPANPPARGSTTNTAAVSQTTTPIDQPHQRDHAVILPTTSPVSLPTPIGAPPAPAPLPLPLPLPEDDPEDLCLSFSPGEPSVLLPQASLFPLPRAHSPSPPPKMIPAFYAAGRYADSAANSNRPTEFQSASSFAGARRADAPFIAAPAQVQTRPLDTHRYLPLSCRVPARPTAAPFAAPLAAAALHAPAAAVPLDPEDEPLTLNVRAAVRGSAAHTAHACSDNRQKMRPPEDEIVDLTDD